MSAEKIRDFIESRDIPLRTKAEALAEFDDIVERGLANFHGWAGTLGSAFFWDKTKSGHNFWKNIDQAKKTKERKMLKVGDKVTWQDPSYSFGIWNGKYDNPSTSRCRKLKELFVAQTGLRVMKYAGGCRDGFYTEVCDILITDNVGGFWFTQSRFVELCNHTITIGDKTITISNESYENLKKQLND